MTKEDFTKINDLMEYLSDKRSHNHPAETITQLFSLHNLAFPNNPEYSKSCGSCRERVFRRLTTYWSETKANYGY